MSRLFRGAKHAEAYAKFRPVPPEALINRIVDFVKEKIPEPLVLAVDVGCGSGQSTRPLAKYFEKVIGTDCSETQIHEARERNDQTNITYSISLAESIPVDDKSVQLITAGQACHWFDMPKFYSEVKRVLVPNGVLALYGYGIPHPQYKDKSEVLDSIMVHFYQVDTGKYWATGREHIDSEYRNIQPPFSQVVRDNSHSQHLDATVRDITGYYSSWSAFQSLCNEQGEENGWKLLKNFENKFLAAASTDKSAEMLEVSIYHPYFLVLARDDEN